MNIKVDLSASGIQRAIDEIKRYRNDLKQKTAKLVSDLVSDGVDIARNECPIRTGNLYNSIVEEFDGTGNKGFVRVNCPYAIFVEMGTGIVGGTHSHPDVSLFGANYPSYKGRTYSSYDSQGHGTRGWWYPTDEKDPNPTKYTAKDGQMYAWTDGMPSRPFMYNTAQQLKDKIRR